MMRRGLFLALAVVVASLVTSPRAQAWGCYHAGYTHYSPYTGLHHYGYTEASRGYGGYGGYHYGSYSGYHYGGYGGAYHYGYYRAY
jgi:hypothetical protein